MRSRTPGRNQSSEMRPLTRQPLRENVYSVLRRLIVQGQFQPGAKILEGRVAKALGVSRTPVREALRRLEYEGLVVTRPGYSTRVTTLTSNDIEQIYPLIAVMEGLAAQLATSCLTSADFNYMNKLTQAMARHARRGEIEKLVAADTQFHSVLHERSQNRRLRRIVRELRGQAERFEYIFFSSPQAVRASVKRHKNLVGMLKRRHPLAAQRTLMRQWELGRRAVLAMIREKRTAAEDLPGIRNLPEAVGKPVLGRRVSASMKGS